MLAEAYGKLPLSFEANRGPDRPPGEVPLPWQRLQPVFDPHRGRADVAESEIRNSKIANRGESALIVRKKCSAPAFLLYLCHPERSRGVCFIPFTHRAPYAAHRRQPAARSLGTGGNYPARATILSATIPRSGTPTSPTTPECATKRSIRGWTWSITAPRDNWNMISSSPRTPTPAPSL